MTRSIRLTPTVVALGLATAATYLLFLGWDQTRDRDPVTGALTGPYEGWQVVGCGVVLLALGLWASLSRELVILAVPVVLTVCWIIDAAAEADDGLWLVGAAMLASCSAAVASLLIAVSPITRRLASRNTRNAWTAHLWRGAGRRTAGKVAASGAAAGFFTLGAVDGSFVQGAVLGGAVALVGYATLLAHGRAVVRRG